MSKYKLSICTIAKNEGPYLLEWLEFHKLVGVEHFYFYDNESSDNTKELLDLYIKAGEVTYKFWPNQQKKQTISHPHPRAVKHCVEHYGNESEWIAIIDLDEFFFSPQKDNLQDVLDEYKNFPVILVNWLSFGSSGHLTKPKGLQIEHYTKSAKGNHPQNRVVKPVFQPTKARAGQNVHEAIPIEGITVTENKRPYFDEEKHPQNKHQTRVHSSEKLRINHYITRSKEDYLNKPRWRRRRGLTERFEQLERECNEIEDFTIQRFLSQVKKNILKVKLKISHSKLQSFQEELKRWC